MLVWSANFLEGSGRFVTRKKRFLVEQIVEVLKQAEPGLLVADVIQDVGISKQTFYRWKEQYAGLESDQVRGHRQVNRWVTG